MGQIDFYLKRIANENTYTYPEDFWELYSFVINQDLRTLLAAYHAQLNNWFKTLDNDLRYEYDIDGTRVSKGGYFHAQDSRDLLALIDSIDQLRNKCDSTTYAFRICKETYDDAIRRCRRFVVKSGGSTIPEDFPHIEIIDLEPVFQLRSTIAISKNNNAINIDLRPIGEGSYATVFRYTDPNYGIPVVLKRANAELDNKEILRFKKEYEVLKELHSPYVVEVYAYDDSKNEYTMESMDESIYEYIRRHNSELTLQSRKKIIAQVCKGLQYIHERGFLHRDISPTNVLIKHYDDVDVVKIGDFGLVKIPESNLTSLQSELKGSLNDPDLIRVGFANYEMHHETYALTRLCFFVLTGRTSIDKQKEGSIKRFWNKGTGLNREERFQSVNELAEAVFAIREGD